jgi:hypothetical protein
VTKVTKVVWAGDEKVRGLPNHGARGSDGATRLTS